MKAQRKKSGQEGYVLLALMLVLTLMLIAMAVEAPRIAQQIKREKEEELVHRGKDYATAVKRFVHKNGGRYPASIEQLENTNHVRFLRKKYKDPITGEDDWKMVHLGEAQIKIPAPNPGPSGGGGQNPGLFNSGTSGSGSGSSSSGSGSSGSGSGSGTSGSGSGTSGSGSGSGLPTSNVGTGQPIGGGGIMGVASVSKGTAIKEFNDKDHYDEWYFVYDLRLEQSGETGVTVAEPRIGGSGAAGSSGQGPQPSGSPTPVGTPAPTPPPVPN
jgi:type II secretory pathway pseudopilin PulG